jgi:hypothetical protein
MGFSGRRLREKIVAVFELASAAARTRIIAANRQLANFPLLHREQTHDVCGRTARLEQFNHRLHVGIDGFEEVFVSPAKIVQSRLAVRRVDESIFWAFTVASEADLTFTAIVR